MKKWIFNPFYYVAGEKALLSGIGIMLLTAIVSYFSNTHFDGTIDVHYGQPAPLALHLLLQLVDLFMLSLFFLIAGMIFSNSKIRAVDIVGTTALARWPALFAAIMGWGIRMPRLDMHRDFISGIPAATIVFSLLSIVFIIWMIVLLYNAFTVSCNIKKEKSVIVFIVALLLSEVGSKILISILYRSLFQHL